MLAGHKEIWIKDNGYPSWIGKSGLFIEVASGYIEISPKRKPINLTLMFSCKEESGKKIHHPRKCQKYVRSPRYNYNIVFHKNCIWVIYVGVLAHGKNRTQPGLGKTSCVDRHPRELDGDSAGSVKLSDWKWSLIFRIWCSDAVLFITLSLALIGFFSAIENDVHPLKKP